MRSDSTTMVTIRLREGASETRELPEIPGLSQKTRQAGECAERDLTGVVRPERFELPASSSGGKRSIQLSYGRTTPVYIESNRAFNCREDRIEAESPSNQP
jgi:hypothetical protein